MKHIVKVDNIQEAKDSDIRPIIALDNSGILFFEGKVTESQIEFVDLGLSVKWSKSLLGATNGNTAESWYGNYYAWGESETKDNYDYTTYKYVNGDSEKLTKYCNDSTYGNDGYTDDLTQLLPEDDVATVTNPKWRTPTKMELEELIALPNEWVTNYNGISGLNGRVFTGNNGNTLFIPVAGYRNSSNIWLVGTNCSLWSSTLYTSSPNGAYALYFYSGNILMNSGNRFYGYNVCPVC